MAELPTNKLRRLSPNMIHGRRHSQADIVAPKKKLPEAKNIPRPFVSNTGTNAKRTLTPKKRPAHVESYTCGRMRVPPIFANREGTAVAIGKVAIPKIPD